MPKCTFGGVAGAPAPSLTSSQPGTMPGGQASKWHELGTAGSPIHWAARGPRRVEASRCLLGGLSCLNSPLGEGSFHPLHPSWHHAPMPVLEMAWTSPAGTSIHWDATWAGRVADSRGLLGGHFGPNTPLGEGLSSRPILAPSPNSSCLEGMSRAPSTVLPRGSQAGWYLSPLPIWGGLAVPTFPPLPHLLTACQPSALPTLPATPGSRTGRRAPFCMIHSAPKPGR